jgi:hypothetical protein
LDVFVNILKRELSRLAPMWGAHCGKYSPMA